MTKLKYCHVQGKVRYPTYYAAARVLKAMITKHHHNGGSCYLCNHCHSWHITHFTEIFDQPYYAPRRASKKQKRSERLKEKRQEYYDSRPMKGEQLYEILTTMRKIRILRPAGDRTIIERKLSQGVGQLKLFVGATTNCALLYLQEALALLEQCPQYRQAAKRQFRRVRTEWDNYERNLKHPGDGLRFFSPQDFEEVYRKRYGDITVDQYFELWQGIGGAMYTKVKPHSQALLYKFEHHFQQHQSPNAHAYATAMTADALLQLAVIVFDLMTEDISRELPPTSPSFAQMVQPLNIAPVQKAFHEGINLMFLAKMPPLTEEETRNINLSTNDISEMWSDAVTFMDIQADTIEDFQDDCFRTRGEAKKLLRLTGERRAEIVRVQKQEFIANYKKEHGNETD